MKVLNTQSLLQMEHLKLELVQAQNGQTIDKHKNW